MDTTSEDVYEGCGKKGNHMQVIDVIRLGKAKRIERYEQVVPTIVIEHPTWFGYWQPDEIEELLVKIWEIWMSNPVDELREMYEEELADEDYEEERRIYKKTR
jgi:hypothetical protein